jgi:hypothetical protein
MPEEHPPFGRDEERYEKRRHKEGEGVKPQENLQASGRSIQQVGRQSRCRAIDDGSASMLRYEQSLFVT